ncbi:MAG: alpha-L-fucosidase [Gemmatimonadaceae bacterium]|nr:alpha-L-fucosidase [Gemmatimonadaceae bacterium]
MRLLRLLPAVPALAAALAVPSRAIRAQAPAATYQPTRASLATHPLPAWFDDGKLGIFIHWGLYSVPGWATTEHPSLPEVMAKNLWPQWFRSNAYAEWYENSLKVPGSATQAYHAKTWGTRSYADFKPMFDSATARWKPDEWAALFKRVGARYVVLTTKHHDGYTLWPSRVPNPKRADWQSRRDLVGELTRAVRAQGMEMGLYYSGGLDWTFNPAAITDFPTLISNIPQDSAYAAYAEAQWRELIDRYQPAVLWNDIGFPGRADAKRLFADYYNRFPNGVINNRFNMLQPEHFDFTTPEYAVVDTISRQKWEATRGIGASFGFNRAEDAAQFLSVNDLVDSFVDIVSKNGNLLLNVGPEADGTIPRGQLERLEGLGAWLRTNGEAIHGTRPFSRAEAKVGDARVRFTTKAGTLYAVLLDRPATGTITLDSVTTASAVRVRLLGARGTLPATVNNGAVTITLPATLADAPAWTLAIAPAGSGR